MAEKYLSQIYYNPESPASFGGVDSIYRVVRDEGKHQISRNKIRLWLQKQDTYTLHKPVRYRFKRNRVIVGAIDEQWEADLVIMDSLSKYNNGFKYVLTVIDVLSKYAWAEPIKTKTGENLVKAFEKILKKGRKPETFHTDKGTEFMNRKFQTFLKKHNIRFFTTQNETKASIVERFNRTLKTKMWKYVNPINHITMQDLKQRTLEKIQFLKDNGHNVVEIWTCDIERQLATEPEMKDFFDNFEISEPLEPRHAFFGGRTNATRLFYETQTGEKVRYVDFCSLYPWYVSF